MGEPVRIHPPQEVAVDRFGSCAAEPIGYCVRLHLPSLNRSEGPGTWQIDLYPSEARALAVALIQQAERVDG